MCVCGGGVMCGVCVVCVCLCVCARSNMIHGMFVILKSEMTDSIVNDVLLQHVVRTYTFICSGSHRIEAC